MATLKVPNLGDSVTQATLLRWHKEDGQAVVLDEPVCELETDKANADVPATAAGVFRRAAGVVDGSVVQVGQALGEITAGSAGSASGSSGNGTKGGASAGTTVTPTAAATPTTAGPTPGKPGETRATPDAHLGEGSKSTSARSAADSAASRPEDLSPAVRRMIDENKLDPATITATGPGGRLTKEDVIRHIDEMHPELPDQTAAGDVDPIEAALVAEPLVTKPTPDEAAPPAAGVKRTLVSKLRKRIAENLVRAQQTAAILTTFNEVDLSKVMELRTKYKEKFEKSHGVGLGFMSFFAKAVCGAIKEFPKVNGQLEGDEMLTFDYVNLGIAVSTERGLAVPVLRNADKMSFAKIESEIKRLAGAVRDGKLGIQELSGGTFTITNGGVFGSLLSTPIINPPQSAILGMHTIQKRPVAVGDEVVVRPMMYLALSYDHRLVDGRESVSFLVKIKDLLEDPARLMLEI